METKWTKLLAKYGDTFECGASVEFELHKKFPLYCEIWGRFVYPNRDPNNGLRLKNDFPPELEDLFNHHYGIWYHLAIAYRQIGKIHDQVFILDIGDPLFHLATAIDLTEKVLVLAFVLGQRSQCIAPFAQAPYVAPTKEYWTEFWKLVGTEEDRKSDFFRANFNEFGKFATIANQKIRHYRNITTHSLPPLMPIDQQGRKLIPRVKVLRKYEGGRWTSLTYEAITHDFELADEVLKRLADQLVNALNTLWNDLLQLTKDIAKSQEYQRHFDNSGGMLLGEIYKFGPGEIEWGDASSVSNPSFEKDFNDPSHNIRPPSGGTISPIDHQPKNPRWIPKRPSANANTNWPLEDCD